MLLFLMPFTFLSLAFTSHSNPVRTPRVLRQAVDNIELGQNVALGSAFASTYLLKDDAFGITETLPVVDQIGLVFLFAAIMVSLGMYIRLNTWGEIEMKHSQEMADRAMRIRMEQSARADGSVEAVGSLLTGFLIALLVGVASFTVGIVVDVASELLPTLAVLVPVSLGLGSWALAALPASTTSALAPILGRVGFFLGIYGMLRMLRFFMFEYKASGGYDDDDSFV